MHYHGIYDAADRSVRIPYEWARPVIVRELLLGLRARLDLEPVRPRLRPPGSLG